MGFDGDARDARSLLACDTWSNVPVGPYRTVVYCSVQANQPKRNVGTVTGGCGIPDPIYIYYIYIYIYIREALVIVIVIVIVILVPGSH